jgi:hypothetical protein
MAAQVSPVAVSQQLIDLTVQDITRSLLEACYTDDRANMRLVVTGPADKLANFLLPLVLKWMVDACGMFNSLNTERCVKVIRRQFKEAVMLHPQETMDLLEAKQLLLNILEGMLDNYKFNKNLLVDLSRSIFLQKQTMSMSSNTSAQITL